MSLTLVANRVRMRSGPSPQSDIGYVSRDSRSGHGMLFPILEQLFVFLLLLSSMNVLSALTPSSRVQTEVKAVSASVDTSSVAIEGGVYIFGGILAVMRWRRVIRAARTVWPLLVLAALACLSTIWSVQSIVTLRRSVALLAATMI